MTDAILAIEGAEGIGDLLHPHAWKLLEKRRMSTPWREETTT